MILSGGRSLRSGRGAVPVSGFADSTGNAAGTVEQFDSASFRQVPFVAPGGMTVYFDTGVVTTLYDFDPSRSIGATGRVTGTGRLGSGGNFSLKNGIGSLTLSGSGTTHITKGDIDGFVAGPNATEIAGIFGFVSDPVFTQRTSMTGAFVTWDPNR